MPTPAPLSFALLALLLLSTCSPPAAEETGAALQVHSAAFREGELIPARHSCAGGDVSPPLEWSAGPPGTVAYALLCEDPDAPAGLWVHWVAWNLPATRLPEGVPATPEGPGGAVQGRNSWGRPGYGGPCPPAGTHRYFFRVYALDRWLDLPPGAGRGELLDAMEGHVLASGSLMGRYRRDG